MSTNLPFTPTPTTPTTQGKTMIEQLKLDHNGFMSTLNIANRYGILHKNVLRDIEKIIEEYNTLRGGLKSGFTNPYILNNYLDNQGKTKPFYLLAYQQRITK